MRESIHVLLPYLKRHKAKLALGMGALVIKDLLAVLSPLVMKKGVDALTTHFEMRDVFLFAALLIVLSAIKGLFQYWMRVVLIGVSRDLEFDLRNDLFAHLVDLSSSFYHRFRTGDIMTRATSDLNAVRMMAGPGVMYWCETTLLFILAVAVMAATDWKLTLLALSPAPLIVIVVIFFGRRIHKRHEAVQKLFSDISSRVQENLSGVRVVRAYAQEDYEMEVFERLNRNYIHESLRLARVSGAFSPLLQGLIGTTFLMVLWGGGRRLLAGELTIGSFVMFHTYMGMLIWPMIAMGWVVNLIERGTASLGRIRELLQEKPSVASPANPVVIADPRGAIALKNVTVKFGSMVARDNVNLTIQAGETLAIVGRTGSGKTTLIRLLARLIDPSEGVVSMDGVDARQWDLVQLRAQIAMVPQETFLFGMTLGENIALGVPGATPQQISWAANVAGLDTDLQSFPSGMETIVGERGITLSGGQKQRVAIARAILRNPKLLILDDALSSVDTITEEKILTGLTKVMDGRTNILISHRVSTVRHADRIVVLDAGRVTEQGTHEELLEANGYYADLHQKQMLEQELEAI